MATARMWRLTSRPRLDAKQSAKLVQAHRVSKKMNKVVWQNIYFSMAVVVFLATVSLLGVRRYHIVIVHEGSTIVADTEWPSPLRAT